MDTFLTFIGIIALLFVAKFIYDSYLTNNTEKSFEEYKNNNPEAAARIERNKGFDLSTKPKTRSKDKEDSLLRMARNMGCAPDEVKEGYINDLKSQNLDQNKYSMMIKFLKEKKYEESKLLNIDPDDTSAAYMEKWTKEYINSLNNTQKAESFGGKGIDNDEALLFNSEGELKFSKGLYNESIELFTSAIRIQPKAIFFLNRADCFNKIGEIENARADYIQVVKIEPNNNPRNVYSRLARFSIGEKDFDSALKYLNKAIELSPERTIDLYNRALAYIGLDDIKNAINDLKMLNDISPNFVDSYILLGNLYLQEKNLSEANKCINTLKTKVLFDSEFIITSNQQIDIEKLEEIYHLEKMKDMMGGWNI